MVTVSIDKCYFEKPAKEGQLLKRYGRPSKLGIPSVRLYMEARAHDVYTGNQVVVLKTNIRFVQISEYGNPIPIGEKGKNRVNRMLEENKE
jgi:acyl-CoA hydrolase